MKRRITKNLGICTYCGKSAKLTSDHIPPKNLFPKPRPTNLVTVRACRKCNKSASKDDEYFRLMSIIRNDVYEQPGVAELWDNTYRGLKRTQILGFAKSLLGSVNRIQIYTPAGIYLGNRASYNV